MLPNKLLNITKGQHLMQGRGQENLKNNGTSEQGVKLDRSQGHLLKIKT